MVHDGHVTYTPKNVLQITIIKNFQEATLLAIICRNE
jgi:hypothetical protein